VRASLLHLCVLCQFSLRLADHLERNLEQLTTIEFDDPRMPKIVEELKEVFESCCGDFPGAVSVRYSYNVFLNKVQSDLRNLEDDKVRMRRRIHEESKTYQLSESRISRNEHKEPTVSSPQTISFETVVEEEILIDSSTVSKRAKESNWDTALSEAPGRKRKQQGEVIDGVIAFAEVTKSTGASLPVLAPLKGAMETLVTLLQNAKVSGGESVLCK
jgi:hypothetical protein